MYLINYFFSSSVEFLDVGPKMVTENVILEEEDMKTGTVCELFTLFKGSIRGFFYYTPGKLLMSIIRN